MYSLLFLLAITLEIRSTLGSTIDLSWDFDDQSVYMRGMQKFSFTKERETVNDKGYWLFTDVHQTDVNLCLNALKPKIMNLIEKSLATHKNYMELYAAYILQERQDIKLFNMRFVSILPRTTDLYILFDEFRQALADKSGEFRREIVIGLYIKSCFFRYAAKEFCAAEHGGTHFDAPYHFNQKGWTVSEVPLARFFAKGALINLKNEHKMLGRETRLTVKHLEDWEKKNGGFENGTVLLIQFGRSRYWQNRTEYLDLDADNITMHFPGISEEAAQWIAGSGKFFGVILDTPSIDPGVSTDFAAHRILAGNSLYNLENVKLLADLPEKGFELIVAPMKIEDGSGAPVRLFARLEEHA